MAILHRKCFHSKLKNNNTYDYYLYFENDVDCNDDH